MPKKSKNTSKTKQSKGNKKSSRKQGVSFFRDERFKVSIGLIFIAFAILLALSFTSFLFTWKADQSKLEIPVIEFFADSEIKVENWIGKLGAVLADTFIYNGFGIASFVFIFIFMLIGFRFLKLRLMPLRKSLFISLLTIIWLSVLLGFIFSDHLFYLGGVHGYSMAQWLNALMGKAGTIILLFLVLFAGIIFSYKPALGIIKGWVNKIRKIKPEQFKEEEEADLSDEGKETQKEDIEANNNTAFEYTPGGNTGKEDNTPPDKDKKHENDTKDSGYELEVKETNKATENEQSVEDIKIANDGDYDPTLDLSNYKMPPIELLVDYKSGNAEVSEDDLQENSNQIIRTLQDYNIEISKITATVGPTVTMYEIVPAKGVRISKIKNLEDDIALSLAALGIRIIAPIPGRGTIGIEVPNNDPEIVSMRSVLTSKAFLDCDYELPVVMGKKINNEPLVFNLAKMPHLLMAGATGQGKSVGLNAVITSLLYKKHPAQLKFVMVDPKKIELSFYAKLERHFLAKLPDEEEPIITDTQKVIHTLNSLTKEMDQRYDLLKKAGARTIKEYNKKYIKRKLNPENGHHYLPYIVVVVDEFADLIQTAGKEIEAPIARLAQLARAIGIHLIIATQRPSTNVITGTIKANFPARISFRVSSSIDSRTILDSTGANQLIGR
ncbi:MAG: DNA translocase FtsK 4TM domain-containing protein, partial [Bacteroidota bacterium]